MILGKLPQFKVQLAGRPDGRYEQDFVCDTQFFRDMENDEVAGADIAVHLDMEKKNDAFRLSFSCRGEMSIPCDRCLEPMDHHVDTAYTLTVRYGDDYDEVSDDLLVIPWSDAALDVSGIIYDTVMLTVPLRHVHPDGGCDQEMAAMLGRHSSGQEDEEEPGAD